jgi:dTDP-4-amino-4,6-dideoxygalactose transaminase
VVRCAERERLERGLARAGIGARRYYEPPLHRQPGMEPWSGGELPKAERVAAECLALPMGPGLGPEVAEQVAAAAERALSGAGA